MNKSEEWQQYPSPDIKGSIFFPSVFQRVLRGLPQNDTRALRGGSRSTDLSVRQGKRFYRWTDITETEP